MSSDEIMALSQATGRVIESWHYGVLQYQPNDLVRLEQHVKWLVLVIDRVVPNDHLATTSIEVTQPHDE